MYANLRNSVGMIKNNVVIFAELKHPNRTVRLV
jgi:hypothetical protein